MDGAGFMTPTLFGFLMVLFRSAALCATAPLFGMRSIPNRLRMGLALVLAFSAFAAAGAPTFAASGGVGALVAGALAETVLGLSAGLAARFAVDAASTAGHLIAGSIGLSFGATLDPQHGTESTSVAELLSMFALAALIAAGIHRELIAWLCRSVVVIPPGASLDLAKLADGVVGQALSAIALAVRMAFPVMAAVTAGHVVLGVLGRTAPQVNISSVGFSVTILAGGGALYLIAPAMTEMAARAAHQALARGL